MGFLGNTQGLSRISTGLLKPQGVGEEEGEEDNKGHGR